MSDQLHPIPTAQLPTSFLGYLKSTGPGLVVVLTWLGAGDIVDMGVAGGNYGYALMWVLVLAVVMRFLFVSLIAKYQLCNPRGEGVLDGLARLHPGYAPLLFVAAIVMGHVYGSYMTVGVGEACRNVTGWGEVWMWALFWNGLALVLVIRPQYQVIETLFKIFLAVLSVSLLGTALWVGPEPAAILQGFYRLEMPEQAGRFDPLLVGTAMLGAIGGSLMNFVYPYFLDAKGWRGPKFRRLQMYDFLLAVAVMIVLNLAIWTLGAKLLWPDHSIEKMDDLPRLLSEVLGPSGRWLFYIGIFSAIYTSLIGHAIGLGMMGSHAWLRLRASEEQTFAAADFRAHPWYRVIAVFCLISPLIWTLPGMPDFVTLTLVANGGQIILLPILAAGLWRITASSQLIGLEYRNRWWENLVMAAWLALSVIVAGKAIQAIWNVL
ncbi:MAG: Nramp family divalent metal transporter [Planctomycetota bacterium]|nr:Nramp family divalent metal transporter [Planctomycetota bacterium]